PLFPAPGRWSWSVDHFLLRLFNSTNSFLLAVMLRPALSDLSFLDIRCNPSLSIELIARIFIKCSSRSCSGTLSSKDNGTSVRNFKKAMGLHLYFDERKAERALGGEPDDGLLRP